MSAMPTDQCWYRLDEMYTCISYFLSFMVIEIQGYVSGGWFVQF